jgi:hypothetical protein
MDRSIAKGGASSVDQCLGVQNRLCQYHKRFQLRVNMKRECCFRSTINQYLLLLWCHLPVAVNSFMKRLSKDACEYIFGVS